jgi:hypothetical protein
MGGNSVNAIRVNICLNTFSNSPVDRKKEFYHYPPLLILDVSCSNKNDFIGYGKLYAG